ncbi:MAG: class I SAM-dependent methyltransferase [Hyphomicrobiaceae bacterium]|nr:class I SAM-dependent methyltransferase [Hyphomicrobiaceae bacterium]
MSTAPGTQGYADEAPELVDRYEAIDFAALHGGMLDLVPPAPALILDIGAGTGRDAAGFAALGHRVLAVEPTDALRTAAAALHASPRIEWLDDGLPEVALVRARGETFDVVMMTAVLMHLDTAERARAIANIAPLLKTGGLLILSLRHGPVPAGRRMFEVSAEETIALGAAHGLAPIRVAEGQSLQGTGYRHTGVTWTRLAMKRR